MVLRLVPLAVAFLGLSTLGSFLYSDAIDPQDSMQLEQQEVRELIDALEKNVKFSLDNIQKNKLQEPFSQGQKDSTEQEESISIDDMLKSFDDALENGVFDQFEKTIALDDSEEGDIEYKLTLSEQWQMFKLGMQYIFLESYMSAGGNSEKLSTKEFVLLIPSICWHFNLKCCGMIKIAGDQVWRLYVSEQYGNQDEPLTVSQKAWVSYVIAKTATLGAVKAGIDTTVSIGSTVFGSSKNAIIAVKDTAVNTACSTYQSVADYIQQWIS